MFQSSESGPPGEIGEGGDIGETVTCLIPLPNKNVCMELSCQRTMLDIKYDIGIVIHLSGLLQLSLWRPVYVFQGETGEKGRRGSSGSKGRKVNTYVAT